MNIKIRYENNMTTTRVNKSSTEQILPDTSVEKSSTNNKKYSFKPLLGKPITDSQLYSIIKDQTFDIMSEALSFHFKPIMFKCDIKTGNGKHWFAGSKEETIKISKFAIEEKVKRDEDGNFITDEKGYPIIIGYEWNSYNEKYNSFYYKSANVGLECGKVNNIIIIDVDLQDNGIENFTSWITKLQYTDNNGQLFNYSSLEDFNEKWNGPIVKTPSGGYHYYFNYKDEYFERINCKPSPGIDCQSNGKNIVYPGSTYMSCKHANKPEDDGKKVHKCGCKTNKIKDCLFRGKKYEWLKSPKEYPIPDVPEQFLQYIIKPENTSKPFVSQSNILVDNKDSSLIEKLLNILKADRADEYNDWINIGFALKNANYNIDIWKQWSATSPKFNSDECDKIWNSIIPRDSNTKSVSLGTIHKFAKDDNKDLYFETLTNHYLNLNFTHDLEINQKYIPESFYSDNIKKFDTIAIRSNMNTGKTFSIPNIFDKFKKVAVVYSRISLCKAIYEKWQSHGFKLYSDLNAKEDYKIDMNKHKRIIIQVDSIHRLRGAIDLLILDEIETTHEHLCGSKQIVKTSDVFETISTYIEKTNKLIIADANLKDETLDYFLNHRKGSVLRVNNSYKSLQDVKCKIVSSKHLLEKQILDALEQNKNIVIPTTSQTFAEIIEKTINHKFPELKVLRIDSKSKKNKNIEVDKWSEYNVLIYSPSITAGVSFEKEHFHSLFAYFPKHGITVEGRTQMLLRVRNIIDEEMTIYCDTDCYSSCYPVDNANLNLFINNQIKAGHASFKEDGLNVDRYENKVKDTDYFKLFRYFLKKKHLSLKYPRSYLIKVLNEHGIDCQLHNEVVDEKLIEKLKEMEDKFELEIKVEEAQKIVDAKILDDLSILDCKQELSEEDSLAVKRFQLTDTFDIDPEQVLPLDWVKTNIKHVKAYKNYKRLKENTIDQCIKNVTDMAKDSYYSQLEQNYEKMNTTYKENYSTTDDSCTDKEESDDEFKLTEIRKRRNIISKKNVRKTAHVSIHYDKKWFKLKHCLYFIKSAGFTSLEDDRKLKINHSAIHTYCRENEAEIRGVFGSQIMNWKSELTEKDSIERKSLMLYVNQKLESMLGIRIIKVNHTGKCEDYVMQKLFTLLTTEE